MSSLKKDNVIYIIGYHPEPWGNDHDDIDNDEDIDDKDDNDDNIGENPKYQYSGKHYTNVPKESEWIHHKAKLKLKSHRNRKQNKAKKSHADRSGFWESLAHDRDNNENEFESEKYDRIQYDNDNEFFSDYYNKKGHKYEPPRNKRDKFVKMILSKVKPYKYE